MIEEKYKDKSDTNIYLSHFHILIRNNKKPDAISQMVLGYSCPHDF